MSSIATVFFGPTQAGKSTSFAKLCGDNGQDTDLDYDLVGDGSGESVTVETTLRSSKIGLVLDTPGINDSKLRFTNDEAGRKVALGVAASGVKKVKFIVFESLANDSIHLRSTLVAFIEVFGRAALQAICLLVAKADRCTGRQRELRLQKLKEIAQKNGVEELVLWQNEDLDEAAESAQLGNLRASLERTPAVQFTDLEDLDSRVQKRAEELKRQAGPLNQETVVQVQEEYVEPRQKEESYTQDYVTYEERDQDYETVEAYEGTETYSVNYMHVDRKPLVAKILTLGFVQDEHEMKTKTETRPTTKYRTVTKKRTITVPVSKTRTATRMVTVYDTKTRTKDVRKIVQVERNVEDFRAEALQQVMLEIRQTLKHT